MTLCLDSIICRVLSLSFS